MLFLFYLLSFLICLFNLPFWTFLSFLELFFFPFVFLSTTTFEEEAFYYLFLFIICFRPVRTFYDTSLTLLSIIWSLILLSTSYGSAASCLALSFPFSEFVPSSFSSSFGIYSSSSLAKDCSSPFMAACYSYYYFIFANFYSFIGTAGCFFILLFY